ncbi:MAG: hypothetical protein M3Q08_04965 [Pseudomonadota bacterium]|nr:hypothetical protein [Pseudomonadota bacterium]
MSLLIASALVLGITPPSDLAPSIVVATPIQVRATQETTPTLNLGVVYSVKFRVDRVFRGSSRKNISAKVIAGGQQFFKDAKFILVVADSGEVKSVTKAWKMFCLHPNQLSDLNLGGVFRSSDHLTVDDQNLSCIRVDQ